MRKTYSFLLLFSLLTAKAFSQCIPNTSIVDPGIYPDSATGLSPAVVGQAYNQVMQIKVPVDTTAELLPGFPVTVPIDSIILISFSGFPPGITYACNLSTCSYPGGSNGCVSLTGVPTTAGVFNITAIVQTFANVLGNPLSQVDTISYYFINVSSATGIDESTGLSFIMDQNMPNPAADQLSIRYVLPLQGEVEFSVHNLIGKEVYRRTINGERGENTLGIDVRDFAPGVYMYTMHFNGSGLTRKMVISRK